MAKRSGDDLPGIKFTSGMLQHMNEQTFGANASTDIAEKISTPGVTQGGASREACYVHSIAIDGQGATPIIYGTTASLFLTTQLQYGNRTGTPAVEDRQSPFVFTSGTIGIYVNASGASFYQMPRFHPILAPVPILVHDELTIAHVGVNNAGLNSKDVLTIIHYQTCVITDMGLYQALLLQQTRTS